MRRFHWRWLSRTICLRGGSDGLFCLVILLCHCTCQVVSSSNNSSMPCLCNSTKDGSSVTNITQRNCYCSGVLKNCTKGYHLLNGTCIPCSCADPAKTLKDCACPDDAHLAQNVSCSSGYFLSKTNNGVKCENCSCNPATSLSNNCNNRTGQCDCKAHVVGRQCSACAMNYTADYSSTGSLLNCSRRQTVCPEGFTRTIYTTNLSSFHECRKIPSSATFPISISTPARTNTSIITSTMMSTNTHISITPILTNTPKSSSTPNTPTSLNIPISTNTPIPNSTSTKMTSTSNSRTTTIAPTSTHAPPSTTNIPHSTNKPVSTAIPTVKTKDTTSDQPDTKRRPTSEPSYHPTGVSGYSTTPSNSGSEVPDKERSSSVVVIVLVSLGVVTLLVVAVAVGWWRLRTRKPSTPFWTVELSNTRNAEDFDFALLDPVTDQPHKQLNEAEADIQTENSRYCAYV